MFEQNQCLFKKNASFDIFFFVGLNKAVFSLYDLSSSYSQIRTLFFIYYTNKKSRINCLMMSMTNFRTNVLVTS